MDEVRDAESLGVCGVGEHAGIVAHQLVEGVDLGRLDADEPLSGVVAVVLDLTLDAHLDGIPVGLGDGPGLLDLALIVGAHGHDGAVEAVRREVGATLGAVAPERPPRHQAAQVEELLAALDVVVADDRLPGLGRDEADLGGRPFVGPGVEGEEARKADAADHDELQQPIGLAEQPHGDVLAELLGGAAAAARFGRLGCRHGAAW